MRDASEVYDDVDESRSARQQVEFELEQRVSKLRGARGNIQVEANRQFLNEFCNHNNIDVPLNKIDLLSKRIKKKEDGYYYEDVRLTTKKDVREPIKIISLRGTKNREFIRELGYKIKGNEVVAIAELPSQQVEIPQRERIAIEEAFTNIRQNIALADSKILRSEERIEKLRKTLRENPSHKESINQMIKDEEEKLELNKEVRDRLQGRMKTQIARLKDLTKQPLFEALKSLFREEGITVVSIVTAVGMTIATIIQAAKGAVNTIVGPPGKNTVTRNFLNKITKLLKSLAVNAAKSLPSIIGSIVSFILSTMGKVSGWVAEHLYLTVTAVVTIILSKYYLK